MILLFPNDQIFCLALTSGLIPAAVSQTPARGGRDAEGRVCVDSPQGLDATVQMELSRLDVTFPASATQPFNIDAMNWLQLLPLRRQIPPRDVTDKTPILFELSRSDELADVVGEILRLGNDRQGFRWIGDGDEGRAHLRVFGPPYYTLLRALDNERRAGAPIAFREAQPRVWVQLGYEHPLADQLRCPEGQLLLLRDAHDWRVVKDGPYRDIYEVLEFSFAAPTTALGEVARQERWNVPLRLTAAGGSETPELYVLRERTLEQVDALVQNADDQLLARFAFAVSERTGQPIVVLRVRPAKQPPPVLVLEGVGYRSYLRLSQLFMPVGRRLHPPLRRDVVAKLLAGDGRHITWLHPLAGGGFQPESLPESAFRPLGDWVEYVLDRETTALQAWAGAHRFAFEAFLCEEEHKPEKPPKDPPRKPRTDMAPKTPTAKSKEPSKSRPAVAKMEQPVESIRLDPSELEKELRSLEKEFLELGGPLESAERQSLWPKMAQLNGVFGHHEAAATCWSHALWEDRTPGASDYSQAWFATEQEDKPAALAAQLEKIVQRGIPTASDFRRLVAVLLVLSADEASTALVGKTMRFLERHEQKFGVRMAWLAWTSLHLLAHGDVLALAKARDRLLDRLYEHGLSPDVDLPNFLRFTGTRAGERFRLIQDHLQRLHPLMQKWADRGFLHIPGTLVYVDLMFAYGLTRLGETGEARMLAEKAAEHLPTRDAVHFWLIDAFQHRIQRAALGGPERDRLPEELLSRLEQFERYPRYKVDYMRKHSSILEPTEQIDPLRDWHKRYSDELDHVLAKLFDINDRDLLMSRLTELLPNSPSKKSRPWGPQAEPRILATALELAPRLGDQYAEDLLFRLRRLLPTLPKSSERLRILQKGIFLAGHYDKSDEVTLLVDQVHDLLLQSDEPLPADELESLIGPTVRSLRRLGLRDHVARLLETLQQSPQLLDSQTPGPAQGKAMRLQLQVAGGWFYFGQAAKARAILDDARTLLLENRLSPVEQTALACAYVATLGQAPLEVALARLMEFFRKVEGVTDTFTTSSHFSLSRLKVVEAVILTLVHEDVTVEPQIRRWLDDDEYLVRRRIHRDVHLAMESAGLT